MSTNQELTRRVMRSMLSLNNALQQAGGCCWTYDKLESMTALEFMEMIAPNNILFKFDRIKEKED